MAILNAIIKDDLKARLDAEKSLQDRSIRAIVEEALTRYFADLDTDPFEPAAPRRIPFRNRRAR